MLHRISRWLRALVPLEPEPPLPPPWMRGPIPRTEEPKALRPPVVADPVLDACIEEINHCIAGRIGYSMDDEPGWPNFNRVTGRKRELEERYADRLLPYLAPYQGLDWKDSSGVTPIEWARFRVAHNWGKNEEKKKGDEW